MIRVRSRMAEVGPGWGTNSGGFGGAPPCSRLSGSWERPANTDKLGVGRCEERC